LELVSDTPDSGIGYTWCWHLIGHTSGPLTDKVCLGFMPCLMPASCMEKPVALLVFLFSQQNKNVHGVV
jgi:hypothetical protein